MPLPKNKKAQIKKDFRPHRYRSTAALHERQVILHQRLAYALQFSARAESYHEVWLQQLTYGSEFPDLLPEYTLPLCKLVEGMEVELWDNNRLKPCIAMPLPVDKIFTGKVESIIAPQMHIGYHAAEASPCVTEKLS